MTPAEHGLSLVKSEMNASVIRVANGPARLTFRSHKDEYEFRFMSARTRTLLVGIAFWLVGTIVICLAGHRLLVPSLALPLYVLSFVAMFLLGLRLFRALRVDAIEGVTLLALPTLLFDPFSCLFFASLFPNVTPSAAGIFGGWMLICCGGAVAGAWAGR